MRDLPRWPRRGGSRPARCWRSPWPARRKPIPWSAACWRGCRRRSAVRARPSGLSPLAERLGDAYAFTALAGGMARASGLIQFDGNSRALPETAVMVPLPIVFALADAASRLAPPGVRVGMVDAPPCRRACATAAAAPRAGDRARRRPGRSQRSPAGSERGRDGDRGVAWSARRLSRRRPARGFRSLAHARRLPAGDVRGDCPRRAAPAARAHRLARRLADRRRPDGSFERDGETLPCWRVPVPCADERVVLWQLATDDAELGERSARRIAIRRAHRRARPRRTLSRRVGGASASPAPT